MKKIWIAVIIVLLIGAFFLVKPLFTGKTVEEAKLDKFAQDLTAAGLTMYGTSWCSHCQNQKKLFDSSFKYINYVDCDKDSGICAIEGIKGYPTWKINGESYPGEKSLQDLARLANVTFE